jgi:hypothetical protein
MKLETIANFVLGCFILTTLSCYPVYTVQEIKPETLKVKKPKIFKLEKTTGETIVFTNRHPGRILENSVRGNGALESELISSEIDKALVKTINREGDRVVSVTTKDEKTYLVKKIIEKPGTVEMWITKPIRPLLYTYVSVVLSEVEKAWAISVDFLKTYRWVLGVTLITVALFVMSKFSVISI